MTHIQAVSNTGTSSGTSVTFPAFTAIGSRNCVVGVVVIHSLTNIISSIQVGSTNAIINTADFVNYGAPYSAVSFVLFNIVGGPTTVTINFTTTPAGTDHYYQFDEYSLQSAMDGHSQNTASGTQTSITTTSFNTTGNGDTIWTCLAGATNAGPGVTPPTGTTGRSNDGLNHFYSADEVQSTAGAISLTWTIPSQANPLYVAQIALTPQAIIISNQEARGQGRGASFIFMPRTMHRDDQLAITPLKITVGFDPLQQFARKHTAPTRAWARLDEQFMPTWNAVLIPKLQSWELPIQFALRLFGQSKAQPDIPSFVTTPVAQPYGFDFIPQGTSRVLWQPKSQSETISFTPQLSILDTIIQFTSRLLSRRPQVENPIVIPVMAAPRTDLELFPRRLITTEHLVPVDLVTPIAPVAPTMAFDREQFPARLEFTPRLQQFESYIIIIATQVLQLTLAAWKWVAQAPSLAFTLTSSLVAWIWKANAAILAQTMILALKAWIWQPLATLLTGTITAPHVVWKWLPQAPSLALSLGFSTPGVVWRWLAQAPGLFFPIILQTTTAVWLWVGRALAGGTHFAKVTYGLLLQVGRLRNR